MYIAGRLCASSQGAIKNKVISEHSVFAKQWLLSNPKLICFLHFHHIMLELTPMSLLFNKQGKVVIQVLFMQMTLHHLV